MGGSEAAAVDDGATENDGFRGGKRRKSDGKVMGFVGFPAWMAGGDSAYAKSSPGLETINLIKFHKPRHEYFTLCELSKNIVCSLKLSYVQGNFCNSLSA